MINVMKTLTFNRKVIAGLLIIFLFCFVIWSYSANQLNSLSNPQPRHSKSSTSLKGHFLEEWSCSDLQNEIESQRNEALFSFTYKHPVAPVKKQSTCISILESTFRCGQVVSDTHVLANPYLTSKTVNEFHSKVQQDFLNAHVFFVHIMKCSGSSVESILRAFVYGRRSHQMVALYYCTNMLKALDKSNHYNIVTIDKRSFGLHTLIQGRKWYFTFMRDPVSRFSSMYYYIKDGMYPSVLRDQLFQPVFDSKNLADFVEKTENTTLPFFDNHAVRFLIYEEHPEILDGFSGGPDAYLSGYTKISPVTHEHYQTALKNLRKMAFVGITEESTISQKMLMKMLSMPFSRSVHANDNTHGHSIPMSKELVSAIQKRCLYDQLLYEEAKRIFESQKATYQAFFPS